MRLRHSESETAGATVPSLGVVVDLYLDESGIVCDRTFSTGTPSACYEVMASPELLLQVLGHESPEQQGVFFSVSIDDFATGKTNETKLRIVR